MDSKYYKSFATASRSSVVPEDLLNNLLKDHTQEETTRPRSQ